MRAFRTRIFVQGCVPTVVRAMVVNAAQLATYSQAKQALLSTGRVEFISMPYDKSTKGAHEEYTLHDGLLTQLNDRKTLK